MALSFGRLAGAIVLLMMSSRCITTRAAVGRSRGHKTSQVAIIGGGASGLSAAYQLAKLGYENVEIFEMDTHVGGVVTTRDVDGRPYDMSTMYVAHAGISGAGIEPNLKEMIDVSEAELIPAVDLDVIHLPLRPACVEGAPLPGCSAEPVLNPLPEPLWTLDRDTIKEQLLAGLQLSTRLAACYAQGSSCVECGICATEYESLESLGRRLDLEAYTNSLVYLVDSLAAGPGAVGSLARTGLLSYFGISDIGYYLRSINVTAPDLPKGVPPNIASIISSDKRWSFFKQGYQSLFDNLVKKMNFKVRTSSKVTSLEYQSSMNGGKGKWIIKAACLRQKICNFKADMVIVTVPPKAALSFLPDGPQKDLIQQTASGPPNDVYIARVQGFGKGVSSGLPARSSWVMPNVGLGSLELINPSDDSGGTIKPFFWQKRHADRDIVVIGTYTLDPFATPAQVFDDCKHFAYDNFGFNITEMIHHQRYDTFPTGPTDPQIWNAEWPALQGQKGLFFTGEHFSGPGMPAIANYASRVIPAYFSSEY